MNSCLAALLFLTVHAEPQTTVHAEPVEAPALAAQRPAHELSASLVSIQYGGFFRTGPGIYAGEVAYHHQLGLLRLGGGLRGGAPNSSPIDTLSFPLELFAQAQLRLKIGFWEPLVGPELGFSGLTDLGWNRSGLPDDVYVHEQDRVGLFYVAFRAEPLRFRWSRFTLSIFELTLGTTLSPPGASTRTEIGYARIGVDL
jgi:hypothetical protein